MKFKFFQMELQKNVIFGRRNSKFVHEKPRKKTGGEMMFGREIREHEKPRKKTGGEMCLGAQCPAQEASVFLVLLCAPRERKGKLHFLSQKLHG